MASRSVIVRIVVVKLAEVEVSTFEVEVSCLFIVEGIGEIVNFLLGYLSDFSSLLKEIDRLVDDLLHSVEEAFSRATATPDFLSFPLGVGCFYRLVCDTQHYRNCDAMTRNRQSGPGDNASCRGVWVRSATR